MLLKIMNLKKHAITSSNQVFIFGFIGTFNYWHGIEVLQKIIPAVIQADKTIHFLLIGEGPLKQRLQDVCIENALTENVLFTGSVAQHKAPEYLALCDAFLCPTQPNKDGTRFFGSPTKLFEYMSMAKPTIASCLEQLAEVVSPAIFIKSDEPVIVPAVTDEVGFTVDSLDVQGFIEACIACKNMSQKDREKMGANARQKILDQYTWQQHVKRIIEHVQL